MNRGYKMDIYEVANKMKLERKTIFDLNLRVTFYARVSTTMDSQENSIENQITFFTNLIQNNRNWIFVNGYADRIRGESASNRIEFQRMINDAKSGKFDLIITKEVSRFARNTIDSLTYTRDLLRYGVGVFFQNDNICTIDTDSELRLTIMSSIAADEVRKLSERVKFGQKRSIEDGKVLGSSRIFGYTKINCKLVVDEKEAEMVRMIFDLYETGEYSTRKICKILESKGYLGRNNTPIHHNTVAGILQNPKYKGYYCGNKVTITDYRTKEQRFKPESEWVMYKDESGEIVPAIVSEEQWDKCHAIFLERSQAIKSRSRSFKDTSVLSGKVWCKLHNVPYWRTSYSNSRDTGHSIYQWICREKKRVNASACSSFAIMESELYNILGATYQSIVASIDNGITTLIKLYNETVPEDSHQAQIDKLKAEITKWSKKQDKLYDLYMDDIITKQEFSDRKREYEDHKLMLSQELELLKSTYISEKDLIDAAERIKSYISKFYTPGTEMTKSEIDDITAVVLDHIDVEPIDDSHMKLEIKLKSSENPNIQIYTRTGAQYGCCSGHITKKMIDAYKMQ